MYPVKPVSDKVLGSKLSYFPGQPKKVGSVKTKKLNLKSFLACP